ncbi:MAG: replicative DNA helicase [Lachnospirales bacterium]
MAENNKDNAYLNRVMPHDIDAEQAVLSCMMYDVEGARIGAENLASGDFYSPANGMIFNAVSDLYNGGKPIDIVTVKNKIEELGLLDKVGGMEYIVMLSSLASTSANTNVYVDIVKEKSVLRNIIKVGNTMADKSYEGQTSVDEILSGAEQGLLDISQDRKVDDFAHIHQVVAEAISDIAKANNSTNHITGIETGFHTFDLKTAGLHNSDLILIAGRPAMGKTTFALNIAQHVAVHNKITTAIFSLEMSKKQLVNRFLASEGRVDATKIRGGGLNPDDFERLAYAMGVISEAPIFIDDTPGITPNELRAKARKLKMEHGLGLIVIDYLQLMASDSGKKNESVQAEVAYISKSLKGIARELDVPVIALSQLSRAVESRTDKRPQMSDLRDSGAIEQDADLVCFLFREEYYFPEKEEAKNKALVIIGKQRSGPTGDVPLVWQGQYNRFDNMATEKDDVFANM